MDTVSFRGFVSKAPTKRCIVGAARGQRIVPPKVLPEILKPGADKVPPAFDAKLEQSAHEANWPLDGFGLWEHHEEREEHLVGELALELNLAPKGGLRLAIEAWYGSFRK